MIQIHQIFLKVVKIGVYHDKYFVSKNAVSVIIE